MDDFPLEAQQALGLAPGETLLDAWRADHQRGNVTRSLPNFPDGLQGYLALTSRRIIFVAEAGNRFSRSYQVVPPLAWSLGSLNDAIPTPGGAPRGRGSWIHVGGEFFSVGKGGAQESGRAHWALERARKAAHAPAPPPVAAQVPPRPPTAPPARAATPPPSFVAPATLPATPAPAAPLPVSAPTAPVAADSAPPPMSLGAPPSSPGSQGLSRPGAPTWPMVPLTLVESADVNSFWSIVGSSGVDRARLLVFCTESPGELSASYGLAGSTLWRISSNEGEGRVRPGDVDRLGDLVSGHFDKGSGQAVVMKGLDRVIEEAGFRAARRLLEVAREAAERTRGAVIIHADPVTIAPKEMHQLEDDAKVLRV